MPDNISTTPQRQRTPQRQHTPQRQRTPQRQHTPQRQGQRRKYTRRNFTEDAYFLAHLALKSHYS